MASELTPAQRWSIVCEYRLRVRGARTVAEVCRKYGISRPAFKRIQEEWKFHFDTEHGFLIAAIHDGGGALRRSELPLLSEWLDYTQKSPFSEKEFESMAADLVREGVVDDDGETWSFAPGSSAATGKYIFVRPSSPVKPVPPYLRWPTRERNHDNGSQHRVLRRIRHEERGARLAKFGWRCWFEIDPADGPAPHDRRDLRSVGRRAKSAFSQSPSQSRSSGWLARNDS